MTLTNESEQQIEKLAGQTQEGFLDNITGAFFRRIDWAAFWIVLAVSFGVYFYTLAPTLTLEDSGELAVASDYLGVPHPPGYPIWTLLTWFFQWVFHWVTYNGHPNPAWSVGLASAAAGAGACALLALLISRSGADLLRSVPELKERIGFRAENLVCLIAGISGGLLLAFSPVLWSQSVIVEVYSLNAFFQMAVLLLIYMWMCRPKSDTLLYLAAFLFGLGLTNHQTLLFLGLALALAVVLKEAVLFRDYALAILPIGVAFILAAKGILLFAPPEAFMELGGADGALWGGEWLLGDYRTCRRMGHLEYLPLPGGDAATRQPWRSAAGYLLALTGEAPAWLVPEGALEEALAVLVSQVARGVNAPRTSSMGRLFDAVAALLGVRGAVSYEAQAAAELEMLARGATGTVGAATYPFALEDEGAGWVVRLGALLEALRDARERGEERDAAAWRFHRTIVAMVLAGCRRVAGETGVRTVALTGGCFQNRVLLEGAAEALGEAGFRVLVHRQVPANDGGVSFGQAAVAALGG